MSDWHEVTIGPCRLICADCVQVLPTLSGVDAVVTDPPYEIVMEGGGIGAKRGYTKDTAGFTDCGFDYSVLDSFDNWACFGTLKQVPKLIDRAGDRRWMLVTWNKPNPTPLCNGNYLPDTEYIIHSWRKGGLHGQYADKARYIVHPSGDVEDGTHPNEKPVKVMSKIVRLAAGDSDVVCDPYMGSGSTGVACVAEGRRFVGVERERWAFDIAVNRIRRAWQLKCSELPFEQKPTLKQRELL